VGSRTTGADQLRRLERSGAPARKARGNEACDRDRRLIHLWCRVDDGERFSEVLEATTDSVEVLNFGVAGYGTDQELLVFEHHARHYAPDAVILTMFLANDLTDISHDQMWSYPKPAFRLQGETLVATPPVADWGVRLRDNSYLVEFLYRRLMGREAFQVKSGVALPDSVALLHALLGRLERGVADANARLVVVLAYLPSELATPRSPIADAVVDRLTELGARVVDTHAVFTARSVNPKEELYAEDGVHWNARGHALVAEALRPVLLQ
jgi:lysophospholipase L1-like esterase